MPTASEVSELMNVLGGLPIVSLALIVIGIAIVAIVVYQFFNRGIVNTLAKIIQAQQGEIKDVRNEAQDARERVDQIQERMNKALESIAGSSQSQAETQHTVSQILSAIQQQNTNYATQLENVAKDIHVVVTEGSPLLQEVDEKIDHIVASVDRLTESDGDTQIMMSIQELKTELLGLKSAVNDLRIEVEKRRTKTQPIPIITDEQLEKSA
jgi:uncharacterized protein YoxC